MCGAPSETARSNGRGEYTLQSRRPARSITCRGACPLTEGLQSLYALLEFIHELEAHGSNVSVQLPSIQSNICNICRGRSSEYCNVPASVRQGVK